MPLFDFLQRNSRKNPSKDNPFGPPELQKKRYDAALEFLAILQERFLPPDGHAHAGTVLSASAWLAGTSLYESFDYRQDIPPGSVVLSDKVNEEWPGLMTVFMYYCQRNGYKLKTDELVLMPPEEHKPQVGIQQVREEFQDRYDEIMKKHELDHLEGARAGMIVCSVIFHYHCKVARDIEPPVAAGIVALSLVEGAKTAPAASKPPA